ncbi:MAG: hypothetical protein ACOYBP_08985 [Microbacteriaceae bacterium]
MTVLTVQYPKPRISVDYGNGGGPSGTGTDDIIRTFEQQCLTTLNTGDLICGSSPFDVQPRGDSFVEMQINGIDVSIAWGAKVGGFAYFSNDGGGSAVEKAQLVEGSTAHWIDGDFHLDPDDGVRVRFEALL